MADKRQQRRAAYHEAAHAVARIVVGAAPAAAEIMADGSGISDGTGKPWKARATGQYAAWDYCIYALSGAFAEARFARKSLFECMFVYGAEDYLEAKRQVDWLVARGYSADERRAWRRAEEEARRFVKEHWPSIDKVAGQLIARGRVEAWELESLVWESVHG